MVKARVISQEEIETLEAKGNKIKTRKEYRRLESVLLRAKEGKTAEEIGVILKINPRTVEKHHRRYFEEGLAAFDAKKPGVQKGTPRHTTVETEKTLFSELKEKAQEGEILKAGQIKPMYEERIGRTIGKSTIYKILKRNRWSKKQPRPRHPEGNDAEKESFKKTS
jgi:transposase